MERQLHKKSGPKLLKFSPPDLEARVRSALAALEDIADIAIGDVELCSDLDPAEYEDLTISPDTEVQFQLTRCDSIALPLSDVLKLVDEIQAKSMSFDGLAYHSARRTLLRLAPQDVLTARFVDGMPENAERHAAIRTSVQDEELSVGLVRRSLHFGLALVTKGFFYDKYYPPLCDDVFVEVQHSNKIGSQAALDVAYAYLFEIGSSLSLRFDLSARVLEAEYGDDDDDDALDQLNQRLTQLRPLLVGPGLGSLFREFQRGTDASDPEIALLYYVKCMEYVSATVVRERQYEDLRKRLQSSAVLAPSAAFMDDLVALIDEHRIFTKDHEALKATIEKCCDAVLLASHAPPFLAALRAVKGSSKPTERKNGLTELAACLSATRNKIAHAKANYEMTGKECPEAHLRALVLCAKSAAEQCIRWYAAQNPDLRRGARSED